MTMRCKSSVTCGRMARLAVTRSEAVCRTACWRACRLPSMPANRRAHSLRLTGSVTYATAHCDAAQSGDNKGCGRAVPTDKSVIGINVRIRSEFRRKRNFVRTIAVGVTERTAGACTCIYEDLIANSALQCGCRESLSCMFM